MGGASVTFGLIVKKKLQTVLRKRAKVFVLNLNNNDRKKN